MNRIAMLLATVTFLSLQFHPGAWAQEKYPERPVQAILPYSPGGPGDLTPRLLSDFMTKQLGQPVVPLNKPGSGGFIAGGYVAAAKPDGYTIGMFANTQAAPEVLAKFRPASYSSKDLVPAVNFSGWLVTLTVRADSPFKSFKEFVEYAKSNPGKLRFGHPGVGNRYWIAGMALADELGIKMKEIPFNSEGEYLTALLGGHIDVSVMTYGGSAREHILAKTLRVLCVFEEKRIEELPDVPTVKELGHQSTYGDLFIGIFAPKGTSPGIISRLADATTKVIENPEFVQGMKRLNMPIKYMNTKDFESFISKDSALVTKFLKEKGYI